MKEGQPQGYKFKHSKRISLGDYRGVAGDLMQLHDPTADGFMRTSDMRSDIVVTTVQPDRVHKYDQLGHVRVGKLLDPPRLDLWKRDGLVHTVRRDGVWMIAINDQALSGEIAEMGNNGKRFDQVFTERFAQELERGLKTCLKKEKLLNNGEYNLAHLSSYVPTFLFPLIASLSILDGSVNSPEAALKAAVGVAGLNLVYNTVNLASASDRMEDGIFFKILGTILPSPTDPVIKHSIFEYIAFPIPVDRVARGIIYLNKHGSELIESPSQEKVK